MINNAMHVTNVPLLTEMCTLPALVEKMHGVDCLLESFCSTRTSLNTHATRDTTVPLSDLSNTILPCAEHC